MINDVIRMKRKTDVWSDIKKRQKGPKYVKAAKAFIKATS